MPTSLYRSFCKNEFLPLLLFITVCLTACKKLVEIPPPAGSITTSQVFADSADATSAIAGIYNNLINTGGGLQFGDGMITIYCGESADELMDFFNNPSDLNLNSLKATTGSTDFFWSYAYQYLYQANTCIESLQASSALTTTTKNQLLGEAKFFRAFFHFYLVNLYGDVPLILTSDYKKNMVVTRTPKADVYKQIIMDLTDAQGLLRSDYSISGGKRTRINQGAATAFLARVYLYTNDWANSASAATAVINNSTYSLDSNLNDVFLASSSEAILQWQLNSDLQPYNVTTEGYQLIPSDPGNPPNFYISDQLLNAFEAGDERRTAWIDSSSYSGTTYYYPYKYKDGPAQSVAATPPNEYYMVLRLAEQYLIRAEAEANGATGGILAAIDDLNVIRVRAGLSPLPSTLTPTEVSAAVAHERQIELFAEWGHRWLDLKRTGQVDQVMTLATPLKGGGTTWESYQQLYPIPLLEIRNDSKLTQNLHY